MRTPLPRRRRIMSLKAAAIRQIELMLEAEYRLKRKPLPPPCKLRTLARKFHKNHFE